MESQRRLTLWSMLWRLGLFTGLVVALFVVLTVAVTIGSLIVSVVQGGDLVGQGLDPFLQSPLVGFSIPFVATALTTLFMYRVIEREPMAVNGFAFVRSGWRWFLWGALLGAGLQTLLALVGWLTGGYSFSYNWGVNGDLARWVQYAAAMFLVGWYEEALCRGYPMRTIEAFAGRRWAAGLTAVVFAVLHLGNPGVGPGAMLGLITFGLVAACSIYLTGSLWLAIGEHMAWNIFEAIVFGFPNSGVPEPYALLRATDQGPAWWTGGSFGPEAGLLAMTCLVLGVLFIRWLVRRRAPYLPGPSSHEAGGGNR